MEHVYKDKMTNAGAESLTEESCSGQHWIATVFTLNDTIISLSSTPNNNSSLTLSRLSTNKSIMVSTLTPLHLPHPRLHVSCIWDSTINIAGAPKDCMWVIPLYVYMCLNKA